MDHPRDARPSPDPGSTPWERLLAGDPTAPFDLAVAYLDPLAGWLERRFPDADPHDCTAAAEDAIMSLAKNPRSYRPELGTTLDGYLRMAATGDLKNLQAKERRHQLRQVSLDRNDVELSPDHGKYLVDELADPARIVEDAESSAERVARSALPAKAREQSSPMEARVWALMQQGAYKTAEIAPVLGIEDWPPIEQRREVKRVKDRLKKRFERAEGDDE